MYWILFVMGTVVAIVAAVLVGGLVTPRAHVVSRAVTLGAAPVAVWSVVRDVARYAEWRTEVRSVDIVSDAASRLEWRETTSRGSVTFGATVDEAPREFAARILDEDLGYTGAWSWSVHAHGPGSRLVLTERGEVGNVLFRFVAAHLIGHQRSIDRYLQQLATTLGEPDARIVDVTFTDAATDAPTA